MDIKILTTIFLIAFGTSRQSLAEGALDIIALSGSGGTSVPAGPGFFSTFGAPVVNNTGQVAFHANLSGAGVTTANGNGIYLGTGNSPLHEFVREGQAKPGSGVFEAILSDPDINNVGNTMLLDNGILAGQETLSAFVAFGDNAPDGNGTFSSLQKADLNDQGKAAFIGFLNGTNQGLNDNGGIFFATSSSIVQIVRETKRCLTAMASSTCL